MSNINFKPGDIIKFDEGFSAGLVLPDGTVLAVRELPQSDPPRRRWRVSWSAAINREKKFELKVLPAVPADAWYAGGGLDLDFEAYWVFDGVKLALKHACAETKHA